jgi:hypothetical protein
MPPSSRPQAADDDVYGGSGLFQSSWRNNTQKKAGYGMFAGEDDGGTSGAFAEEGINGTITKQKETLVTGGLFSGDALKDNEVGAAPTKTKQGGGNSRLKKVFDDEDEDDDFEEEKKKPSPLGGSSKPQGKSAGGLFRIDDDDEDDKPSFMNNKSSGGYQPPAPTK